MIEANKSYSVEVTSANLTRSQSKGTLALEIWLETEEKDSISHMIWLSKNSKENAVKTLSGLGVSEGDTTKKIFWDNVGSILVGRKASITTISEEWKGKTRIKVQWLNAPRDENSAEENLSEIAAGIFTGTPF